MRIGRILTVGAVAAGAMLLGGCVSPHAGGLAGARVGGGYVGGGHGGYHYSPYGDGHDAWLPGRNRWGNPIHRPPDGRWSHGEVRYRHHPGYAYPGHGYSGGHVRQNHGHSPPAHSPVRSHRGGGHGRIGIPAPHHGKARHAPAHKRHHRP